MNSDWSNEKSLNIRTKLALRVLMLMFSIIAPYQFGHQFEAEIKSLKEMLDKAE